MRNHKTAFMVWAWILVFGSQSQIPGGGRRGWGGSDCGGSAPWGVTGLPGRSWPQLVSTWWTGKEVHKWGIWAAKRQRVAGKTNQGAGCSWRHGGQAQTQDRSMLTNSVRCWWGWGSGAALQLWNMVGWHCGSGTIVAGLQVLAGQRRNTWWGNRITCRPNDWNWRTWTEHLLA